MSRLLKNEQLVLDRLLSLDENNKFLKNEFCRSFLTIKYCSALSAFDRLVKKGIIKVNPHKKESILCNVYEVYSEGKLAKTLRNGGNNVSQDMRAGYVYLYTYKGSKNIKIGVTSNVEKRVGVLNGSCGCKGKVLFSCKVHRRVESELHIKYDNKRVFGEWFNLTKDDVQEITNFLKEREL